MKKKAILFIEDDPKTYKFFKQRLVDFNYSVFPKSFTKMGRAINPRKEGTIEDFAIQQIKENYKDIRLVLCDIQLGKDFYGGETVVKIIREIKDLDPSYISMLPIIGITNYTDRQKGILDAGADYTIEKFRIYNENNLTFVDKNKDVEELEDLDTKVFYSIIKRNIQKFDKYLIQMHIIKDNKVFIVHGHDIQLRKQVEEFIRVIGYEPIVLSKVANKGRSIFKKIEEESDKCCFSIILYTKCDEGKKKGTAEMKDRARQNVVFEYGYMSAKMGLDHACALVDEGIEMPSDLTGIIYVPNDRNNTDWRYKIVEEMRAAGLDIDENKINKQDKNSENPESK